MQREIFSPLAIDALGEMMNISLGSSATAVSNMLDRRVDITTPKVSVVDIDEFSIAEIEPAMGVEIKYVSGLEGSNIMLLKKEDIKVIVDILMGQEDSDDTEFELNELTISAVCEVMNQMMGASATALSDFLGYSVNISTPSPFEMHDFNAFKHDHIPHVTNMIVVIRFALKIEDKLESEFMNVISVELARELLNGLGLEEEDILGPEAHLMGAAPAQAQVPASEPGSKPLTQEEIEKLMSDGASTPEPEVSNKPLTQEEIEKLMSGGAPVAEPEVSNQPLTQEEIEKLMSGGASTPEPEVSNKPLTQEEIEKLMGGGASAEPAPAPQPQVQAAPQPQAAPQMAPQAAMPQQMPQMPQMPMYPMPDGQMGYPPNYYPPYPYPYPYPYPPQPEEQGKPVAKAEPKTINAKSVKMNELGGADALSEEQAQNLDLIMEVPLQVTVEIGRTRRKVQDILSYTKGSLVVLDKLAGDQVDLYVNGKCIAKGDVVVVDDNFGVRITEIVQMDGGEGLFSK
ncbi:MAG: flagellar motor switch protein FliN [Oscillospiraceae bacterium]|nr:flagellar motor switch protein FliN [Oscillospiraceae bacterium]